MTHYKFIHTLTYTSKEYAIEKRIEALESGFPCTNLFISHKYMSVDGIPVTLWAFKVFEGAYNYDNLP